MRSDEQLFEAFRTGDNEAFAELYGRYAGLMTDYFARCFRQDAATAEDVVQETFISATERRDEYNPAFRFSSWLYGIASHIAIAARKERKREAKRAMA